MAVLPSPRGVSASPTLLISSTRCRPVRQHGSQVAAALGDDSAPPGRLERPEAQHRPPQEAPCSSASDPLKLTTLLSKPTGVDELVALAKLVRLARRDELGMHFDRVIVDTAPTGHTLRLLTYPDFLDRFIERCVTPDAH